MKLPGINYGPVQSLGREDIGAPLRVAGAVSQAAQQWSKLAGDLYDKESVAQSERAAMEYTAAMSGWLVNQDAYQTDNEGNITEGTWINGQEIYQKSEKAIADSITKKHLKTPLARQLWEKEHAAMNFKNTAAWSEQLTKWQQNDQIATMSQSAELHRQNHDWEKVRQTYAKMLAVGLIDKPTAVNELQKVDYEELQFQYSEEIEGLYDSDTAYQLRKRIQKDGRLQAADKSKMESAINDRLVNNYLDAFHTQVQLEEERGNIDTAVAHGRKLIDEFVIRERPEKLGGDGKFKESLTSQLEAALNRYRVAQQKKTAETKRYEDAQCYLDGRCVASPEYRDKVHDDGWAFTAAFWPADSQAGYDRNAPNARAEVELFTNPEFREDTKNYALKTNYMPKTPALIFETAIFGDDDERAISALNFYHELYLDNPSIVYRRENNRLTDIVAHAQILGGNYTAALENYRALESMDEGKRKELEGLGGTKEFNDFFEKNIENVIEERYGRDRNFWELWKKRSPEATLTHINRIKKETIAALPRTRGDFLRAMNLAAENQKYMGSVANGDYELMENAPEMAVPGAKVDGGKWLRRELEVHLKKELQIDNINMDNIKVYPVANFSYKRPLYQVFEIDPDTGVTDYLGPYEFIYEDTIESAKENEEKAKLAEVNKQVRKDTMDAAAFWAGIASPAEAKQAFDKEVNRRIEARQQPVFGQVLPDKPPGFEFEKEPTGRRRGQQLRGSNTETPNPLQYLFMTKQQREAATEANKKKPPREVRQTRRGAK